MIHITFNTASIGLQIMPTGYPHGINKIAIVSYKEF